MNTFNLYIGDIKGIVRINRSTEAILSLRTIKKTVLKRLDYNLYEDIFDKKRYGV